MPPPGDGEGGHGAWFHAARVKLFEAAPAWSLGWSGFDRQFEARRDDHDRTGVVVIAGEIDALIVRVQACERAFGRTP